MEAELYIIMLCLEQKYWRHFRVPSVDGNIGIGFYFSKNCCPGCNQPYVGIDFGDILIIRANAKPLRLSMISLVRYIRHHVSTCYTNISPFITIDAMARNSWSFWTARLLLHSCMQKALNHEYICQMAWKISSELSIYSKLPHFSSTDLHAYLWV